MAKPPIRKKRPLTKAFKNRIVGHDVVDPKSLLANPDNWRIHPDYQRAILRGSLGSIGWVKSVQVQQGTGLVVDGHARIFEAVREGEPGLPVEYVDLSDDEVRTALASLDPITDLADQNLAKLSALLSQIETEDDHLASLFDGMEQETGRMLDEQEEEKKSGNSNFKSIKKAFRERKVTIKAIYALDDAELVEDALEATGKKNRSEALCVLATTFLTQRSGPESDDQTGRQHELDQEDPLEAALARAPEA